MEGPQDAGARRDEGRAAAEKAKKAFRAAVAAEPTNADAHAGLGEAVSRCGVPYAGMATIMGVVESSIRALEKALELEPTHWQARFILGMNYFPHAFVP